MNPRIRKFIAAVEIAAGFLGMALASASAAGPGLSILPRILTGVIGIPFGLCAYAGRSLWLNEPRGYFLSILVQAAQVPAWSSPSVFYIFYCGAQLGAWFGEAGIVPLWGLGSRFTLYWIEAPRGEAVGLNFVALLLLGYLVLDRVQGETISPGSLVSTR